VRSTLVGRGAAPPDQPVILEPGSAIDARYRLEERIAGGGMGEVWRARDDVLGRVVALKVLRPEYADDPEFRARFRAEARHTAALSHPGIATVHDYGEVEAPDAHGNVRTSPYLVLELVPGESLARLLAREGRLSGDRALDVLAQAGRALQAAHDAGIVHRDVKPANLLVRPNGVIKVTDLGIARAAGATALTGTGAVLGTPHYLSPEQAAGRGATPASDVYALGVVGYQCLAGRRPYAAEHPAAILAAHRELPPDPLPADVPEAAAQVVLRALAKRPGERTPSAEALAREATRARAALTAPEPRRLRPRPDRPPPAPAATSETVPAPPRARGPSRRRGRLLAAVAVPVIAAGVVVAVLLGAGDGERSAPRTGGSPRSTPRTVATAAPPPATPTATAPAPTATTTAPTAPTTPVPAPTPTTTAPVRPGPTGAGLVGRPYRPVVAELRRAGVRVRVVFSSSTRGSPAPGTVYEAQPAGRLRPGTRTQVYVQPTG